MDTFGSQALPNSFYLPILSDSSGDVYPTNKLSHFRVLLETPLYLSDGEWLCGLAEVIWPHQKTASSRRRRSVVGTALDSIPPVTIAAAAPTSDHVPTDNPSSDTAGAPTQDQPEGAPPYGENAGDSSTGDPEGQGWLPPAQKEPSTSPTPLRSKRKTPDPTTGTRIFVYVDFIRPSLCSDFRGKCLRILALDTRQTQTSLHPVYYYPVEKKVIDGVFVEIKNKSGDYFPFEASDQAVVIVLHFKRAGALVANEC